MVTKEGRSRDSLSAPTTVYYTFYRYPAIITISLPYLSLSSSSNNVMFCLGLTPDLQEGYFDEYYAVIRTDNILYTQSRFWRLQSAV